MIKIIGKYFLFLTLLQIVSYCNAMERRYTETDFGPYFEELNPELQAEVLKPKIQDLYNDSETLKEFQDKVRNLSLVNKRFHTLMRSYPLKNFINLLMIKKMVISSPSGDIGERLIAFAQRDDLDKVELLLNELEALEEGDARKHIGWALNSALHKAVVNNNKPMVEFLLKHEVNPNGIIVDSRSTLIAAVKNNNKELVDLLLKAGVDVDVHEGGFRNDLTRRTALMFAALNGYNEIVSLLIDVGANPNLVNKEGFTALHFAIDKGFTDTVRLLLEKSKDIDVNVQDQLGNTPLMKAVEACNKDAVKLLLDVGANRGLANRQGNTALTIAELKDCTEIIGLLKD